MLLILEWEKWNWYISSVILKTSENITKLRQWDFFTHWLTHYIKLECFERNRLVTCLIYLSAKYVPLRSRFKGIWICALKIQTNPNNIGLNKKNRPYNIVRLRNNRRVFVIIKRLLYRLMIKITFGNTIQYCVYLKTPANHLDKKVYHYCYLIEIRIEIRFRLICSICLLEFQCCFNLFKEKLLLAIYLYVEHFSYNLQ